MRSVALSPLVLAAALLLSATATTAAPRPAFSSHAVATGSVSPEIASHLPDGAGGFFLAWSENRRGSSRSPSISTAWVRRVTSSGDVASGWPVHGVEVSGGASEGDSPLLVSDGSGGVIVAWNESRRGFPTPYAQHIDATGGHLWALGGVALTTGSSVRAVEGAIADGAGGAYVMWRDFGPNGDSNVAYSLQHVSGAGAIASGWPAAGLGFSLFDQQVYGRLLPDGAGGVLAFWENGGANFGYRGERFTSSGARLWSPAYGRLFPGINPYALAVTDGAGGAIVAWTGAGTGGAQDVLVQRFDHDANALWPAGGVTASVDPNGQDLRCTAADGLGGVIVGWHEQSGGGGGVQRVLANGSIAPGWNPAGVKFAGTLWAEYGDGYVGGIVPDFAGGAWLHYGFDDSWGGPITIRTRLLSSTGAFTGIWADSGRVAGGPDSAAQSTTIALGPDGAGGEILTWFDGRGRDFGTDLYAQRVGATGLLWDHDGKRITTNANAQRGPALVPDGAGGANVAWSDHRGSSWDVYGKRLNAAGALGNSLYFSSAARDQHDVLAVGDGASGIVAGWLDHRALVGMPELYAQRVTSGGIDQFPFDGLPPTGTGDYGQAADLVSLGTSGAYYLVDRGQDVSIMRLDGNGTPMFPPTAITKKPGSLPAPDAPSPRMVASVPNGVLAAWVARDIDPGTSQNVDELIVQPIDGGGSAGVPQQIASTTPGEAIHSLVMTSDGPNNGAYIAWTTAPAFDVAARVRLQHVDANGALLPGWPAGGLVVVFGAGRRVATAISLDGQGGVVVAWDDTRDGVNWQAYAQRVSILGVPEWTGGGVALGPASGPQHVAGLTPVASGGAIAVWMDGRGSSWDLRAQRITGTGTREWGTAGLLVCGAPGTQEQAVIAADGSGGSLVAWQDERSLPADQVAVQRIDATGNLLWTGGLVDVGGNGELAAARFAIRGLRPNPAVRAVTMSLEIPDAGPVRTDLLDVAGRVVWTRTASFTAGRYDLRLDGSESLAPGLYFARITREAASATARFVKID